MVVRLDYEGMRWAYHRAVLDRGMPLTPLSLDQVKEDIRRHRKLFQTILATSRYAWMPAAYVALKEHITGRRPFVGTSREAFAAMRPQLRVLDGFVSGPPGKIPTWLIGEIRYHLSFIKNHPDWIDRVSPASFTLKLAASAYQDAALQHAKTRVRRRWRMQRGYQRWFAWFLDQERRARLKAMEEARLWLGRRTDEHIIGGGPPFHVRLDNHFSSERSSRVTTLGDRFIRNHSFPEALDGRDTSEDGDLQFRSYQLPFIDFEADLQQVTQLLGGHPDSLGWQDWALAWLHDFPPVVGLPLVSKDLETLSHEFRSGWSVRTSPSLRSGHELAGKLLLAHHRLNLCPDTKPVVSGLSLRLTSRWVELSQFPVDAQAELYANLVQLFGFYEEPRGPRELVRDLEGILATRAASASAVEELWEKRGDRLETLPIEEQKKLEAAALANARKRKQRTRRRLTPG